MSMQALRAFMRTKLSGIKAGKQTLREWTDGFNSDNIPDTILDGGYHLEPPEQSYVSIAGGGNAVQWKTKQTVLVFFEGYKDTTTAIDAAIKCQEDIIKSVMASPGRLNQAFKNIMFKDAKIDKVNQNNNTSAKLEISFEVDVYLDI